MRNPGVLVETKEGKRGIIYKRKKEERDVPKGKEIMHVVDKKNNPIIETGKPKRVLVNTEGLKIIGFVD